MDATTNDAAGDDPYATVAERSSSAGPLLKSSSKYASYFMGGRVGKSEHSF